MGGREEKGEEGRGDSDGSRFLKVGLYVKDWRRPFASSSIGSEYH